MDASEVQRWNAHSPINLTLEGMLIEMSDAQSRKATYPILNVPSGMMTSPFSSGGKAHPASASLMCTAITKTHAASWQVWPRCLAGIITKVAQAGPGAGVLFLSVTLQYILYAVLQYEDDGYCTL